MKVDLNISDPAKAEEFLQYFVSHLKTKRKSLFLGSSKAKFNEKGQYEIHIQDFLETDEKTGVAADWIIIQNPDGSIPFIQVSVENCSNSVNRFLKEVLASAFSERKNLFFVRNHYCFIHGSNLCGEYWINSKLRLGPLYPDDDSKLINAERIIVLDQQITAVDKNHACQLGQETSIIIAARLSFIFDLGFYEPRQEKRWFIHQNEESKEVSNKRMSTGIWDTLRPSDFPKKGKLCKLNRPVDSVYKRDRYAGEDLSVPQETREIFKGFDQLDYKYQLAFNKSCRLYQTALIAGAYSPTIRLSYMYGAVDAICQTTSEHKGFSEFVKAYNLKVDNDFLEFIHGKIRSNHWHSGEFILGENESKWKENMLDKNAQLRFNIIREGHNMIRLALLNWVFDKI